mmetsp:Transcript_130516/g.226824  ORF Transcript_130516/g.226824 Transcript_130516/m.226824 type:complete len:407 (-) Transcript_130516:256-1476(-)
MSLCSGWRSFKNPLDMMAFGVAASALLSGARHPALITVAVALIAILAVRGWLVRRPRDTLMELASAVKGPAPPELVERAQRVAAKIAKARVPLAQDEQLAMLDVSPSQRYSVDDPEWLEHLDREGYAVVAGVADKEQLGKAEDLLWEFLEQSTTWRRGSPETWSDEGHERIGSVHNGLVNAAGVGQSPFLWHCRTLPAVRKAFSKIWSTSDLLVSFDGANVFRPWHHGFRKTVCGWWHVDQGAAKKGRHAVQGFVSIFEASGQTGGLTVVPRSHLRFQEVVQDQQNPKVDYVTVQNYEPIMQELPQRLVCCEAGDLVLWDSRTIHANAPAPQQPIAPKERLLRAVAYICMVPKSFAPEEVRVGRRTAFEYGFNTTHWPQKLDLGSGSESPQRSLASAPTEVADLVG